LSEEIFEAMQRVRQQLLENFDDEVREKLRVRDIWSKACLNRYEHMLMQLTRHELKKHAYFVGDTAFRVTKQPFPGRKPPIPMGLYELPRRRHYSHLYRLGHPLAEALLARIAERQLPPVQITFNYAAHAGKISILESLQGKTGWMIFATLTVENQEQGEDYALFAAQAKDGTLLDDEQCIRMLTLPGRVGRPVEPPPEVVTGLNAILLRHQAAIGSAILDRNNRFFAEEADKLESWADDMKLALERELNELERQIKESRREATQAATLEEKLAGQKRIKALEATRNQKRRALFDAQDQVDARREEFITTIHQRLKQSSTLKQQFVIRWKVN
ncbi:MAG: DEAD/DEAH box helicase, partial [Magnetococcales bacterium]|nr:DEAD/DEAH box helicase [Magnetococcales bacterium]